MNSGTMFVSVAIVSELAGAPVNAGNGQVVASAVVIPSGVDEPAMW